MPKCREARSSPWTTCSTAASTCFATSGTPQHFSHAPVPPRPRSGPRQARGCVPRQPVPWPRNVRPSHHTRPSASTWGGHAGAHPAVTSGHHERQAPVIAREGRWRRRRNRRRNSPVSRPRLTQGPGVAGGGVEVHVLVLAAGSRLAAVEGVGQLGVARGPRSGRRRGRICFPGRCDTFAMWQQAVERCPLDRLGRQVSWPSGLRTPARKAER